MSDIFGMVPSGRLLQQFKSQEYINKMASTRKIYNGLYIVGNDHNNVPINQHKVHTNGISRTTILYIYFLVHDPKKITTTPFATITFLLVERKVAITPRPPTTWHRNQYVRVGAARGSRFVVVSVYWVVGLLDDWFIRQCPPVAHVPVFNSSVVNTLTWGSTHLNPIELFTVAQTTLCNRLIQGARSLIA